MARLTQTHTAFSTLYQVEINISAEPELCGGFETRVGASLQM